MNRLFALFTAASTVVAAESPMPSCSSREVCGAASEAQASGVVLLSSGSAMSRARFHDAETSETKHDNKESHSSVGRLAATEPSPKLQTQTPTSVVLLAITTHLHGTTGVIFVILLACICVCLLVIWRWRQQSKQAEIYEDVDDYAWKHEFWVRGHRPQAILADSPQVRSILPRATTKAQVAQRHQQQHEERAQMGWAQAQSQMGSAPALGTAGALGSAGAVGAGAIGASGAVGPERGLRYLDGAVDSAVDGAQQGFTHATRGVTSGVLGGVDAVQDTTSWATRSVFKKVDRFTGKSLTDVKDSVADKAATVQNRWNEARHGAM